MSCNRRVGIHGRCFQIAAWLTLAAAAVPRSLVAQIAFDAASTATGNLLTMSWSHTVGTGTQRLLVVGVTVRNGLNLGVSVTYGGTGLTLLRSTRNSDNAVRAELWYLKNPASGTANVTVTLLGAAKMAGGAVSFSGVNQTTPIGAIASDSSTGTGTTNPTTTVTSATGNLVIDAVAMEGSAGTVTAGANQTQRWTNTTGSAGGEIRGVGSTEPGAASVTMSWTKTNNAKWAIVAASINPAAAPSLSLVKFADVPTPKPGDVVTFSATTTNTGTGTAVSLVSTEAVPANTDFKLGSAAFAPGTSGLTTAVSYSNNGGSSYTYTPVSGGGGAPAGYDRTVTHVRWTMTGNLSPTSPNNSYGVSFQVRIR
ncbi:MAG TPA: hypothetical protein VH763_05100 [Gemmatimonadales bacterium]